MLKVQAIRTSPYHPQICGLCECFDQTLVDMLKFVKQDMKNRYKLQLYLLFP